MRQNAFFHGQKAVVLTAVLFFLAPLVYAQTEGESDLELILAGDSTLFYCLQEAPADGLPVIWIFSAVSYGISASADSSHF